MRAAATINVANVETKPTRTGGTVYKIRDHNGREYVTFDAAIGNHALACNGKAAQITFTEKTKEKDGRTYTDYYLDSIEEAAVDSAISTTDPVTGARDWDMIGLRKTRCALWAAFLQSPLAAQIATAATPTQVGGQGGTPAAVVPTSLVPDALYRVGWQVVRNAEMDIFTRPVAEDDDDVPF